MNASAERTPGPSLVQGGTVNYEGRLGLIYFADRDGQSAIIRWDDTGQRATVHASEVLYDDGACEDGGRPGSPYRCDLPTAPGFDLCSLHGGRDPL